MLKIFQGVVFVKRVLCIVLLSLLIVSLSACDGSKGMELPSKDYIMGLPVEDAIREAVAYSGAMERIGDLRYHPADDDDTWIDGSLWLEIWVKKSLSEKEMLNICHKFFEYINLRDDISQVTLFVFPDKGEDKWEYYLDKAYMVIVMEDYRAAGITDETSFRENLWKISLMYSPRYFRR